MTNNDAIEILKGIQRDIMPNDELSGQRTEDVALDLAIKALEQTEVIKKATEDILEHRHAIYSREDECFNTGLETAYALIKAVLDEDEDIPMEYLEAGGTL